MESVKITLNISVQDVVEILAYEYAPIASEGDLPKITTREEVAYALREHIIGTTRSVRLSADPSEAATRWAAETVSRLDLEE